jgi:hypothetical protein
MTLGLTQSLTEMSTTNLPRDKVRPAHKAYKRPAICEPIVWTMWDPIGLQGLLRG